MKKISGIIATCSADNISNDISNKLELSKDLLQKWLLFIGTEDDEPKNECGRLKNSIFKLYSEKVNLLINQFEIYYHDLSDQASTLIMELVDRLSRVDLKIDNKETQLELQRVYAIEYCLYLSLAIDISASCIQQSEAYKKIYKQFNYKGIDFKKYTGEDFEQQKIDALVNDGMKFFEVVNNAIVSLNIKRLDYLQIKEEFFYNDKGKNFYNFEVIERFIQDDKNDDLWYFVNECKWYLETNKRHYPFIIGNGYRSTTLLNIMKVSLYWILPIFLGGLALILKLKG